MTTIEEQAMWLRRGCVGMPMPEIPQAFFAKFPSATQEDFQRAIKAGSAGAREDAEALFAEANELENELVKRIDIKEGPTSEATKISLDAKIERALLEHSAIHEGAITIAEGLGDVSERIGDAPNEGVILGRAVAKAIDLIRRGAPLVAKEIVAEVVKGQDRFDAGLSPEGGA